MVFEKNLESLAKAVRENGKLSFASEIGESTYVISGGCIDIQDTNLLKSQLKNVFIGKSELSFISDGSSGQNGLNCDVLTSSIWEVISEISEEELDIVQDFVGDKKLKRGKLIKLQNFGDGSIYLHTVFLFFSNGKRNMENLYEHYPFVEKDRLVRNSLSLMAVGSLIFVSSEAAQKKSPLLDSSGKMPLFSSSPTKKPAMETQSKPSDDDSNNPKKLLLKKLLSKLSKL